MKEQRKGKIEEEDSMCYYFYLTATAPASELAVIVKRKGIKEGTAAYYRKNEDEDETRAEKKDEHYREILKGK